MNWTGGLAAQITKLLTCGLIYKMDWDVTQVTRTIETFKKCRLLIATQHNYFLIFNQLLTLTRNVSEAVGTANRSKMRQTYIERNMATPGWWPQLDQRATKQLRQKQLEQTCAEQLYLRGSEWLGASWNVLERVWMDWHTLEWQRPGWGLIEISKVLKFWSSVFFGGKLKNVNFEILRFWNSEIWNCVKSLGLKMRNVSYVSEGLGSIFREMNQVWGLDTFKADEALAFLFTGFGVWDPNLPFCSQDQNWGKKLSGQPEGMWTYWFPKLMRFYIKTE
jgi:hypothetical protein